MAALIDTNILVYRFDTADPRKQALATELLRRGLTEGAVRVPHQAIVEFVAVVTRARNGATALTSKRDAYIEAEHFVDLARPRLSF